VRRHTVKTVRRCVLPIHVMVRLRPEISESGGAADERDFLSDMCTYNEELIKAGVTAGGEGFLQPSSKGAGCNFSQGNKRTVVDGTFPETKKLIRVRMWKVKSKDEARMWTRCPASFPGPAGRLLEYGRSTKPEDLRNDSALPLAGEGVGFASVSPGYARRNRGRVFQQEGGRP